MGKGEKTRAAVQRNQGLARASQPVIWFFDDDILFEPECVARLWPRCNLMPAWVV